MTPVLGGGLSEAYQVKMLAVLARDIVKIVEIADPAGKNQPQICRNVGLNNGQTEPIRKILGRIIHASYLAISNTNADEGKVLDIINDKGERSILSFDRFTKILKSLILKEEDAIIVMCNFTNRRAENIIGTWSLYDECNLNWLLKNFCQREPLVHIILEKYFPMSAPIDHLHTPDHNGIAFSISGTCWCNGCWWFKIRRSGSDHQQWIKLCSLLYLIRKYSNICNTA